LTRETVLGHLAGQREKITELVDDFGSAGYAEPSRKQEGVIQFLGIDVGTEGTRALIIDEQGRVIASASEEHAPFASPQAGWAEQDPNDWWRACTLAVRRALAAANQKSVMLVEDKLASGVGAGQHS